MCPPVDFMRLDVQREFMSNLWIFSQNQKMLPTNCTKRFINSTCKDLFSGANSVGNGLTKSVLSAFNGNLRRGLTGKYGGVVNGGMATFSSMDHLLGTPPMATNGGLRTLCALSGTHPSSSNHYGLSSRGSFCRSFHSGHHHHEPPHYAYRGDGLPKVHCESVQNIIHINERQTHKKLSPMRPADAPLYTFECSPEAIHLEAYNDLQELHNHILAANWHDTVHLTMNADIWESALNRIKVRTHDLPDAQVQIMLNKTLEIFDALYQVEDVQDHIYELIEELSVNASEGASAETSTKVTDNFDQHIAAILAKYEYLKQRYPRYASKIQDTIGYSLALLRQRYTFTWPEEHKYFY